MFKIGTNGAFSSLYSLDGTAGSGPDGLVQGSDGSFYGTTPETIFRLTSERPAPEFQAVVLTNGTLNLTWSTEPGGRYQLQYNSDLSPNTWTNLGSVVTAVGAMLRAEDSVANTPQRFYRIVTLP